MNKANKVLELFETFNPAEVDTIVEKFQKGIQAPYVKVYKSTLGGADRPTVMITISLDPKESWSNGILQNSRYFHMSYYTSGELDQFSRNYNLPKFRKARTKDSEDALAKINGYIKGLEK